MSTIAEPRPPLSLPASPVELTKSANRHAVHLFPTGEVKLVFDCWAGVHLDWAMGRGVPLDFAMQTHGVNLTFAAQEKSRSRLGGGQTLERPLAQGAVILSAGETRSWVANDAAFEGLNINLDPSQLAAYAERNGMLRPLL